MLRSTFIEVLVCPFEDVQQAVCTSVYGNSLCAIACIQGNFDAAHIDHSLCRLAQAQQQLALC